MPKDLYETGVGVPAGVLFKASRHYWLVAAVTLAALVASVAWLGSKPPRYEATARLLVTPVAANDTALRGLPLLRESGDMTRVMLTAATLVDSRDAALQTAKSLGGEWSAERVKGAVSVDPEGQSNILAVTAVANSAAGAALLANAFAKAAIEDQQQRLKSVAAAAVEVTQSQLTALPNRGSPLGVELSLRLAALNAIAGGANPTLAISDPAFEPRGNINPSPIMIYGAALIAGLVAGIGAALLMDAVSPRQRFDDQFEDFAAPEDFTPTHDPRAEPEARRGRAPAP